LLSDLHERIMMITLNRAAKHNAFDEKVLIALLQLLDEAIQNKYVRAIILKANGKHFSAGADLNWMQRMAQFNEEENLQDAMILARLMHKLHHSPKPTIAMVQGAAFGGGAGLVAACDIAIASHSAQFCFSEVKLGLIPAVISPYVIKAIGERVAKWLFMSAEIINAEQARNLNLIHHCVNDEELLTFTLNYAQKISNNAPKAVAECKTLINTVSGRTIDLQLIQETAALIAKKRVSAEGQEGLRAFLNKQTPNWDKDFHV